MHTIRHSLRHFIHSSLRITASCIHPSAFSFSNSPSAEPARLEAGLIERVAAEKGVLEGDHRLLDQLRGATGGRRPRGDIGDWFFPRVSRMQVPLVEFHELVTEQIDDGLGVIALPDRAAGLRRAGSICPPRWGRGAIRCGPEPRIGFCAASIDRHAGFAAEKGFDREIDQQNRSARRARSRRAIAEYVPKRKLKTTASAAAEHRRVSGRRSRNRTRDKPTSGSGRRGRIGRDHRPIRRCDRRLHADCE